MCKAFLRSVHAFLASKSLFSRWMSQAGEWMWPDELMKSLDFFVLHDHYEDVTIETQSLSFVYSLFIGSQFSLACSVLSAMTSEKLCFWKATHGSLSPFYIGFSSVLQCLAPWFVDWIFENIASSRKWNLSQTTVIRSDELDLKELHNTWQLDAHLNTELLKHINMNDFWG